MSSHNLRKEYSGLVAGMLALNAKVDERLKILETKERQYDAVLASMTEKRANHHIKFPENGHRRSDHVDVVHRLNNSRSCIFERNSMCNTDGSVAGFEIMKASPEQRSRNEKEHNQFECKVATNLARWDPFHCSADLSILEGGQTITKTKGDTLCTWSSCLLANSADAPSFKVCMEGKSKIVMVGYAKMKAFRRENNFKSSGWFLDCSDGRLYSAFGHFSRAYTDAIGENSIVVVHFDKASRSISFEINNKPCGVAFGSIDCDDGPLYPCVELLDAETYVSLEHFSGCSQELGRVKSGI